MTPHIRRFVRLSARAAVLALAVVLQAACAREDDGASGDSASVSMSGIAAPGAVEDTSYRLQPGYIVDSILPIEEELRRFRADIVDTPSSFRGGASSREALVRALFDALERRDSAGIRGLIVDRAEFAWLVYPSSPYARPPYRQPPGLVWAQLRLAGGNGFSRLLERYSGGVLRYVDHACAAEPAVEGRNRLWRDCNARVVRLGTDTVRGRWFGVIVERDGRFKFANLANQL